MWRALMVAGLLAHVSAAWADESQASVTYYAVKGGKVDAATFRGWRIFHTTCYSCHGVDALGTSIAPSLVERTKQLTARDFTIKVLTRYRIVVPAVEASAEGWSAAHEAIVEEVIKQERGKRGEVLMPAWESDPRVKPHLLDLYGYLKARADGALGTGRPQVLRRQRK